MPEKAGPLQVRFSGIGRAPTLLEYRPRTGGPAAPRGCRQLGEQLELARLLRARGVDPRAGQAPPARIRQPGRNVLAADEEDADAQRRLGDDDEHEDDGLVRAAHGRCKSPLTILEPVRQFRVAGPRVE